jgi:3-deoxy-D-manno-octulosonic-acid transferase
MRWLYNLFIYSYSALIYVASLFNPKAKLWIQGRKGGFQKLITFKQNCNKPIIWIHCASLGEFEQGRPIIEYIRKEHSEYAILLTFFSPSGFEIRKNYDQVDMVSYLPSDSYHNAKKFVELINPQMAIFVKYEYWFNYMHFLHKKAIPLYVISAIFRPNQHFFKPYGSWFVKQLKTVSYFYTQNQISTQLLQVIGINNVTMCGDTRFDRVLKIAENVGSFEIIDAFCNAKPRENIWVIGSSWHPDEIMLEALIGEIPNLRFIIAPHEIHQEHLNQISQLFSKYQLTFYSKTTVEEASKADILVVDTMGMLSQIYQYGHVAFIGGGFGSGIHNILEAAAYQIPVIFGPRYHKFDEAVSLIDAGGAFSVKSSEELSAIAHKLIDDKVYCQNVATISKQFVEQNRGATLKIAEQIFDK